MRILLFIVLMALPACAALPYDGSVLREVVDQNQAPAGAACRCEAVCQ